MSAFAAAVGLLLAALVTALAAVGLVHVLAPDRAEWRADGRDDPDA